MMKAKHFCLLLLVGLTLHVAPVQAGERMSAQGEEGAIAVEELKDFAKNVEKSLAAKGARVALVARLGQEKSALPDGVFYTHVGFWVYSDIETADGQKLRGYQTHNLYQKEDKIEESYLAKDFPIDFLAAVYEKKVGIIIPKPEMQKALLEVLLSDKVESLHQEKYSVVSNPFDVRYQNCTEYTLNVVLAALYPEADLAMLKANAKQYFEPQKISINPLTSMMGSLFKADFTRKDHEGEMKTATFTTIKAFMEKYDLVSEVYAVEQEGVPAKDEVVVDHM